MATAKNQHSTLHKYAARVTRRRDMRAQKTLQSWRSFLIPQKNKKGGNGSQSVDKTVYGIER